MVRETDSTASVGPTVTSSKWPIDIHVGCTSNAYFLSTLLPRGEGPHGSYAYEVVSVKGAKAMGVIAYPANETFDGGETTS